MSPNFHFSFFLFNIFLERIFVLISINIKLIEVDKFSGGLFLGTHIVLFFLLCSKMFTLIPPKSQLTNYENSLSKWNNSMLIFAIIHQKYPKITDNKYVGLFVITEKIVKTSYMRVIIPLWIELKPIWKLYDHIRIL